jgi:hypothetical protein
LSQSLRTPIHSNISGQFHAVGAGCRHDAFARIEDRFMARACLAGIALAWFFATSPYAASLASAAEPVRSLVKLELDNAPLEGTPLAASGNQVILLDRAGRLWDFDAARAKDIRQTTNRFTGYSAATLRNQLYGEFGKRFDVSGTGHYLVVHPAGQGDRWSKQFEELYRSFWHYFAVRGFDLKEPEFPLVAVVFPDRDQFLRYAHADGVAGAESLIGYYSPTTNRIALYDLGEGHQQGPFDKENAATIIHEATHQTAFNTGIHSRFVHTPRWVAEGLGTLFEAPGIWNSRSHTSQKDRINAGRLADFKSLRPRRKPVAWSELIDSDRSFNADMKAAYAEAWAFTFFLVETRPRDYSKFLARTAARADFAEYSSTERLEDFVAIFGQNFKLLDAQFLRFMDRL